MMEMIFSFLTALAQDICKWLFDYFPKLFTFSLDEFAKMFPVAETMYRYFQAIGFGLVIAIAIVQLLKYFVGPLAKTSEKPQVVLIRAFFSVFLIYFAPYILEKIFDITGMIYNSIANQATAQNAVLAAVIGALEGPNGSLGGEVISAIVGSVIILCLCVTIISQFVRMMLEIIERYLITILLIYTSPLAMATFTSESAVQILKKWISMFVAQCILLILSVWGCVLFLSVLGQPTADAILTVFIAYAMLKVIKRFDNYLQQIGLNAAVIGGGSLLDAYAGTRAGLQAMGLFGKRGTSPKGPQNGPQPGVLGRLAQNSMIAQGVMATRAATQAGQSHPVMRGFGAAAKTFGARMVNYQSSLPFSQAEHNQAARARAATTNLKRATYVLSDLNGKYASVDERAQAAANVMRQLGKNADVLPQEERDKAVNELKDTFRNADYGSAIAHEAFSTLAKDRGGYICNDTELATAAWSAFAGENNLNKMADMGEGAEITSASLQISRGEHGNSYDFSADLKTASGAPRTLDASNNHGKLAETKDNGKTFTGKDGTVTIQSMPVYNRGGGSSGSSTKPVYWQVKDGRRQKDKPKSADNGGNGPKPPGGKPGPKRKP